LIECPNENSNIDADKTKSATWESPNRSKILFTSHLSIDPATYPSSYHHQSSLNNMDALPFLDKTLTFPDGTSYQRLEPITDFRQCHGATPPERRILFRCRRVIPPRAPSENDSSNDNNHGDNDNDNKEEEEEEEEELILKIKVQIPDDPSTTTTNNSQTSTTSNTTPPPPSLDTSHELKALTTFHDSQTPFAPRLIAFSHAPQDSAGPLPQEGYISCTVMSKIAGKSLFELGYWSMTSGEREEIQRGFLEVLG
jgi:hypothetical protein